MYNCVCFCTFRLVEKIASLPSIKEISADLEVVKAERESLQKFLKESSEKETKMKRELEEKHAQEVSDLAEKLRKSNQRSNTLAAKNKTYETEAESIDKMIFHKGFSLYSGFFIFILPLSRKKLIILFHSISPIRVDQRVYP